MNVFSFWGFFLLDAFGGFDDLLKLKLRLATFGFDGNRHRPGAEVYSKVPAI